MSIAIVTDSTCDIPPELVEKFDIHIVPNILVINGKSIEDNESFSREKFYTDLPEMDPLPTTSTASSGAFGALYEELLQESIDRILSIHAASLLSGIFNAASLAAQRFGNRVQAIDSQQVSLGLGFQVLAAAEAAAEGLPLEDVLRRVGDARQRVRFIAMLDTLEYIRRSGRVSWARASLISLLQIKPFIELKDGVVHRLGEVRTRKKGVDRLLQLLRDLYPWERLAILHSNAETEARQLLADLDPDLPTEPLIVNVTTIIGTHVGPNGLGFVAVVK
ncbi:MAG TPA: DegV family protein [Anaerolineales bacterium]|nr:DegV family protein [Anaerolineales bacterium]